MKTLAPALIASLACTSTLAARAFYSHSFAPAAPLVEFDQGAGTNGVFTDIINVPDHLSITQMSVSVFLHHTWSGDLVIQLEKLNGAGAVVGGTATLVHRVGSIDGTFGSPNDYSGNYTFTSVAGAGVDNLWTEAIALTDPSDSLPAGTYLTSGAVTSATPFANWGANNNSLLAYNGMDSFGDWRIRITDMSSPNTGEILEWSMTIIPTPGVLAMFAVAAFVGGRRRRA